MRLLNCSIDWNNIADASLGIYFTDTDWTTLAVENTSESIRRSHKRTVSPLEAKKRVITLQGVIDWSGNANAEDALAYLQGIFALQDNLYTLEQKTLLIEDVFNNNWEIPVIVADNFEYDEYSKDFQWHSMKWRVVLESAESPVCFWPTEYETTWHNGIVWVTGVSIDIPFDMNDAWNAIELTKEWNAPCPIRWEMTVTKWFTGPITIYDLSTWLYCRFNVSWLVDDVIIIDWKTKTATKNWTSIMWYRLVGSSRLSVTTTKSFVVQFGTSLVTEEWADISAFYNDAIL